LNLLLFGCVSSSPVLFYAKPAYVVILSSGSFKPQEKASYCTGLILDPKHILSVYHCKYSKSLKLGEKVFSFKLVAQDFDKDLVLFESTEDIKLLVYPLVSSISYTSQALFFGNCSYQPFHVPRTLTYFGWYIRGGEVLDIWNVVQDSQDFENPRNYLCPGDSGGGILQGDNVVGLITSIRQDREIFVDFGREIKAGRQGYFVPSQTIQEFLNEHPYHQ
jgi:hypothetical protein